MRTFSFLRRPVKPALYAILLALILTAALVFAWQYHLDGLVLGHAIDTYAYVGTLVRTEGQVLDDTTGRDERDFEGYTPELGGPAFLEELPEALVRKLTDCGYVSKIDSRMTQAAMLGDYTRTTAGETKQTVRISDQMFSANSTPYYYLEATVEFAAVNDWRQESDTAWDNYRLHVDRMWSDPNFSKETIMLEVMAMSSEPMFQVGQRMFLLGGYRYMGDSGSPSDQQTDLATPEYMRDWLVRTGSERELSVVEENRYILIPEGVDSESYIQEYLESTGLDVMLNRQLRNRNAATVRRTQDMSMIPLFAKGKAKTYEGRLLTPGDIGNKVCVISNGLSQRNRLSVGDTIQLSLADGSYTFENGWETGEQGDADGTLTYGAYEEYEIVGIYTQAGRRTGNTLYFTYNDIFLPAEDGSEAALQKPYTFSFKVPGPDYQNFLRDFEPVLSDAGYTLVVEDTGWDDVKESFYTMQTQRQLMLLCAGAAFAAAIIVFAILLNAHCRYEYGLRRLLGAGKWEARGIYGAVFACTAIPGGAVAVLGSWFAAVHLMQKALASDKTLPLPTDTQCTGLLAAWAAAVLLAAFVLVLLLAWQEERRGLLKLTRR